MNIRMHRRPIDFVVPQGGESTEPPKKKKPIVTSSNLSGEEVQNIYMSIINSTSKKDEKKVDMKKSDIKKKFKLKKSGESSQIKKHSLLAFFSAAQNGDLQIIKEFVATQSRLLDRRDEFGWTALMISSHCGHLEIVKFLVRSGAAWYGVMDRGGNDAYTLACNGGHPQLAHFLLHHREILSQERIQQMTEEALRSVKRERLWCDDCQKHFYASERGDKKDHQATIPHQLSQLKGARPQSHFLINHMNRGYQLLRQQGWDGESGLGPRSDGRKFPVKTILKRDRDGLGLDTSQVARVTHFKPNDASSVSRVARQVKIDRSVAEEKEERFRLFTMDFRRSFH